MWLFTFTAFATNAATTTAANTTEIIIFLPFNGDPLSPVLKYVILNLYACKGRKNEAGGQAKRPWAALFRHINYLASSRLTFVKHIKFAVLEYFKYLCSSKPTNTQKYGKEPGTAQRMGVC